jgi:hypothetical protein
MVSERFFRSAVRGAASGGQSGQGKERSTRAESFVHYYNR